MSTAADFAAAAQALVAALSAATTDPADTLRILAQMADVTGASYTTTAPIGQAIATAQSATADLFRRSAVIGMARASASYQPASRDDALAVMTTICDLLDAEIMTAADQGEDTTYQALRVLRTAVVDDLTTRGADLAAVTTISTTTPVPSLVLAQRIYQDQARADELVTEADPIHPAFMPTSFKALSS